MATTQKKMKNKQTLILTAGLLLTFVFEGIAQMPLNSKRFIITDYYYPNSKNNYVEYRAHGFAQQTTSSLKGLLFFLPIITRDNEKIEFYDENGIDFEPVVGNTKLAKSIVIQINISSNLPNDTQLPAIASALGNGIKISNYIRPMAKGPNDSYLIYPPAQFGGLEPALRESAKDYEQKLAEQAKISSEYSKNYKAEIVSLSELEVNIQIDNDVISSVKYDNTFVTTSGVLAKMVITNPTISQQNRIARGKFNVFVRYKFRDANTSTIEAQFDAKKVIDKFLEETQKSHQSSKSSGWQFLGFGSRKKTVSTSLNSELQSNYHGDNYESTVVEMFDPSDDMIKQFENDFFPEIAKEKVIENHKAAALLAESQGNNSLKELHLKYIAALQSTDPNLEVDISKAVASLAAQDYVGFIANGVRWGSNETGANSSFRRVVHTTQEIEDKKVWAQKRTYSVQHALTEIIEPKTITKNHVSLGLCGAMSYNYPIYTQNNFGQIQTTMKTGMMFSCVIDGGPLRTAGLIPGMIIKSIDGRVITTGAELETLLDMHKPGDKISIKTIDYQGIQVIEKTIEVKLTAGAPILD